MHHRYHKGVGMLLYLVKFLRPDIANAVRKLLKILSGPTEAAYKEILRAASKYMLTTGDLGLKMVADTASSDGRIRIVAHCDSDWSSNPDSRRSIIGYIVYMNGISVCWRTRAQRCVALSSTEAEWYALSECVKDMLFCCNYEICIEVELPMAVYMDNIKAVFLSDNDQQSMTALSILILGENSCGYWLWKIERSKSYLCNLSIMIWT
ncbi:LOW QUALITY PROTEIN: hypothetical protein ACHAWF_015824 [Thalassiosira exigua]